MSEKSLGDSGGAQTSEAASITFPRAEWKDPLHTAQQTEEDRRNEKARDLEKYWNARRRRLSSQLTAN